jgi:hemoglobin-like flavoprotein
LLRKSFDLIAHTKEGFTHAFYACLFERHPTVRPLFAEDVSVQARSFAATLEMRVRAVERGEDLVPALSKLGAKHVSYGAQAEHYPLVGAVLLDTFKAYLGDAFTPTMHQAWAEAYEFISTRMIEAAKTDEDEQRA